MSLQSSESFLTDAAGMLRPPNVDVSGGAGVLPSSRRDTTTSPHSEVRGPTVKGSAAELLVGALARRRVTRAWLRQPGSAHEMFWRTRLSTSSAVCTRVVA